MEQINAKREARRGVLSPRRTALITVFFSSLSVMAMEISAGRLIAPFLGTSLYTWTSIIGVTLAGIAAGNRIGGYLADRPPPLRLLPLLSLLSSAAIILILVLDRLAGNWTLLWTLDATLHIFLHVLLVFFLPSFFLGMISPLAARLALEGTEERGRTLGNLFAAGAAGSIIGTFLAGFLFIPAWGTRASLWITAGLMTFLSLCLAGRKWPVQIWTGVFLFLLASGEAGGAFFERTGTALSLRRSTEPHLVYSDESAYSTIRVLRSTENPDSLIMKLNTLTHSIIHPDDPSRLGYDYNRIVAALTLRHAKGRRDFSMLDIGAGAYVLPRYLEQILPDARIDVVELDPAVTKAAREACGLPPDSRIRIHHADGRGFVIGKARKKSPARYDAIHLDAFDDFSVPPEMMTVEFAQSIRTLLKEDGIYLLHLIDILKGGRLLSAVRNTLLEVFPFVHILDDGEHSRSGPYTRHRTFVILCSLQPVSLENLIMAGSDSDGKAFFELPPENLTAWQAQSEKLVLSDDFVPMESLLKPVVRQGNNARAAQTLFQQAMHKIRRKDSRSAERLLRQTLRLNPEYGDAHTRIGLLYARQGNLPGAERHFRESVRLAPHQSSLRINYANTLAQQGKTAEARREYTRAMELEPDSPVAYINMAVFFVQQGDLHSARQAVRKAKEFGSQEPAIRDWIANFERHTTGR